MVAVGGPCPFGESRCALRTESDAYAPGHCTTWSGPRAAQVDRNCLSRSRQYTGLPRGPSRQCRLLRPFWPERARQGAAALALDPMDLRFDPVAIRTRYPDISLTSTSSYWCCFRGQKGAGKVSAPGGSTNGVERRFRHSESTIHYRLRSLDLRHTLSRAASPARSGPRGSFASLRTPPATSRFERYVLIVRGRRFAGRRPGHPETWRSGADAACRRRPEPPGQTSATLVGRIGGRGLREVNLHHHVPRRLRLHPQVAAARGDEVDKDAEVDSGRNGGS